VEVFRPPDLLRLCVVHVHRKIINQIRWHPQYTAADPHGTPSPYQHWMATGSNDPTIHVIDLTQYLQPHAGEESQNR
jgi:hypothetical protein